MERAEYDDGDRGFLVLDEDSNGDIRIEVGFRLESYDFKPTPEQAREIALKLMAWADR